MRALSSEESTGTRYIHSGSQIWWNGVSYSHGGLPSKRIGSLPSGVPRSKAPVWHEAMTQDPCVGSRDLLGSLLCHAIHRIGECRRSEKQPMRACSHVLLQRCRCAQCPSPLSPSCRDATSCNASLSRRVSVLVRVRPLACSRSRVMLRISQLTLDSRSRDDSSLEAAGFGFFLVGKSTARHHFRACPSSDWTGITRTYSRWYCSLLSPTAILLGTRSKSASRYTLAGGLSLSSFGSVLAGSAFRAVRDKDAMLLSSWQMLFMLLFLTYILLLAQGLDRQFALPATITAKSFDSRRLNMLYLMQPVAVTVSIGRYKIGPRSQYPCRTGGQGTAPVLLVDGNSVWSALIVLCLVYSLYDLHKADITMCYIQCYTLQGDDF